ncbi:hypothetical protein [Luteimonas terricola]|uniref:hypothetical protein n=1 Tax=Luteimonas terricola TaxID=645597 RepID=UPI00105212CB|nr:hypothetical protein [Luteimonas terricola]
MFQNAGHCPAFFVRGVEAVDKVRALSRNSVIEAPFAAPSLRASARDVHTDAACRRIAPMPLAHIDARIGQIPRSALEALKTSAFLQQHRHVGVSTLACAARRHVAFAGDGGDGRSRAVPSGRRRVLTPKKTVIRFRHNNTWQQKRVSANQATARDTTQSSAGMPGMVGSGVVSPAKTRGPSNHATRDALRSGFFRIERYQIRHDALCASSVGRGSDTRGAFRTGQ